MNQWNKLNNNLATIAANNARLEQRFGDFATYIKETNEDNFHLKGISSSYNEGDNYFLVYFSGKIFRFQFSTQLDEQGALHGKVDCYLMPAFPKEDPELLSAFTFSGSGQTELKEADTGDPLNLTYDIAALYIALDSIYEGLK